MDKKSILKHRLFRTLDGIVGYIFIHTFTFKNILSSSIPRNCLTLFFFIFIQRIKCMRLKKCIQSICLWVVNVRLDTSILPYKMHYQEMICLQFARKYIFLIAKEKSRTYKRSSTSKEPHIGHYSLLIRVSRRKPTLVARCMVNAIT